MLRATICNTATGFYQYDKAVKIAAELQAADEDWTYKAVDCTNGLGRIDVIDEDGVVIEEGFLV